MSVGLLCKMSQKKTNFFIGTVKTLFESSDESDNDNELLHKVYDANLSQIEVKKKFEGLDLDDNYDDLLNESYDKVKHLVEVRTPRRALIPENMIHLVRRTRKEILRSHLMAKILLREKSIPWIETFKSRMSDYFFAIEMWPNYAIEILLSRDFGYSARISLASFMHGNGLTDRYKALIILQTYNKHWHRDPLNWRPKFEKFKQLFSFLDQTTERTAEGDRIRYEYWYYDINQSLTMYYNGDVRTPKGKRSKYNYPTFGKK